MLRSAPNCPLCASERCDVLATTCGRYFCCDDCDYRFLSPQHRLSPSEEKRRYEQHNNDVLDPRYQDFVRPLYELVSERVPYGARGLDFGAGSGPVLAKLLEKAGYGVSLYDPFFWPEKAVLDGTYDFICSCEVMEHLFEPARELALLRHCLRPGGILALMTLLYHENIDFHSWYYRRDPTHVGFFSRQTFQWIGTHFGFSRLEILSERTVVLS